MTKKIALYCRVSTSDQKTGLEAQIRALKEYCEKNQIGQYELYTDENFSGAKVSRPSLDRMMDSVRNDEVSTVIVYSFSRFARSTTHLLNALEEMKIHGTEFISVTERIETNSPMGKAFFTVIAAISQLERELIVERVKNGLRNAKLKGIKIGRRKTRPSELIRTLRRSGLSYSAIAKITNVSEGAISAELAQWRGELSQQNRTIGDEMASHAQEKLARQVVASNKSDSNVEGTEDAVSLEYPKIELEIVR
jgi:DNA invertase Pin-like site-specific DNA recombinase